MRTTKDYELATWGIALSGGDGAVSALAQNLRSDSPTNRVGFKSPIVDQALKDIRVAKSDAEKTAVFGKIAEEVDAQVPFVTLAATEEYNTLSPKLQGAVAGGRVVAKRQSTMAARSSIDPSHASRSLRHGAAMTCWMPASS